ncbi:MAG TPA: AAA family ATPase, partial [Bacteroidales bacterium]|nr:AAA family ATPase [Bacteroidales bacterium]HPT09326.1 AAA family ATPase [Bacteroidales bacterium]
LDDGRLTDNKGRTVDFKNTIIIMTSNIGSTIIRENLEKVNDDNRSDLLSRTREQVFDLLKKSIRPEFLNRVDEIIMFQPLTREEIEQVVTLQVNLIRKMLEKNDIRLEATAAAIRHLASIGFDPQYGARPIKRVLQKYVLNELSKKILEGKVDKETVIRLDEKDGKLSFENITDIMN